MNNVAKVFNMTGANSAGAAQSAVNAHNLASDAHEKKFAGKQDRIESLPEKNVLADADTLPLTDSEEQNAGKRISWASIKAMLGKLYVPMTRRINNRALSADVTLTGDDIKTSATDETSLSSALSNKVNIPIVIEQYTALNTVKTPGFYYCGAATESANLPPNPLNEGAFSFLVEKTYDLGVAQTLTWYYLGAKYTRTCSNVQTDEWSAWEKIATATPPQRYVLQLADGWVRVNAAEYWRTQEGLVIGYISHCSLRWCRN